MVRLSIATPAITSAQHVHVTNNSWFHLRSFHKCSIVLSLQLIKHLMEQRYYCFEMIMLFHVTCNGKVLNECSAPYNQFLGCVAFQRCPIPSARQATGVCPNNISFLLPISSWNNCSAYVGTSRLLEKHWISRGPNFRLVLCIPLPVIFHPVYMYTLLPVIVQPCLHV